MRFESSASSDFPKLPSFLQWLKAQPEGKNIPVKVVKVIWFPNQFPNFSIDTESFRLRIPFVGPSGEELKQEFENAVQSEKALVVRVTDKATASYSLEELEEERMVWVAIGTSGYKGEVAEKKGKNSQRASKKPVSEE